jgi:hypothetical protein
MNVWFVLKWFSATFVKNRFVALPRYPSPYISRSKVQALFFYSVLLPKTPYTQQQPMGCAEDCVLASASWLGCGLVVEISASRTEYF